jgi:hypothetical protein
MATFRVPTICRAAQTAHPIADSDTTIDVDMPASGPDVASTSYIWLCLIIGAALSVGIGVGVELDHAGMTEGATSWIAGVVAFWAVFVPLIVAWVLMKANRG